MKTRHRSKYSNRKTTTPDGISHDSKREASRWLELVALEKTGVISGLKRQVAFELAPSVKLQGDKRRKPALKYVCDFTYYENGKFIVEDVKAPFIRKETIFRMKQHLMKSVHGLDIRFT